MSNDVYPSLPGLRMVVGRTVLAPPVMVRTTPSRREYRARDAVLTRYRYKIAYEFLRTRAAFPEMQALAGFFNKQGGAFRSFLFTDPIDNTVTDQVFGTGDGVRTSWPLARSFGGFVEAVDHANSITLIKINTLTTAAYTLAGNLITFTAAPAPGAVIFWSGSYYRRVRFEKDDLDLERVIGDIWEGKSFNLLSCAT